MSEQDPRNRSSDRGRLPGLIARDVERHRVLGLPLLGLMFVGVGVALLLVDVGVIEPHSINGRRLTRGTVTRSEVHSLEEGQRTLWSPEVGYDYEVEGERYAGTRWVLAGALRFAREAEAAAWVRDHPVGGEVTVHYLADDPADAVLHPHQGLLGARVGRIAAWVFGGFLIGLGLIVSFFAWRQHPWRDGPSRRGKRRVTPRGISG